MRQRRPLTEREKARKRRGGKASANKARAEHGGMTLPVVPWRKTDREFHRGKR